MSNQLDREVKEYLNLFADPRYSRKAIQKLLATSLVGAAKGLPLMYDKDGNPTLASVIEKMAYDNCVARLRADHIARDPMQAELMIECNVIRARLGGTDYVNVRDSIGAKPVDISKVDQTINDYSGLSDEELELIAAHRKANPHADAPPEVQGTSCNDEPFAYFKEELGR